MFANTIKSLSVWLQLFYLTQFLWQPVWSDLSWRINVLMKWDHLRTSCMPTGSYREGHLYWEQHRNGVADESCFGKAKTRALKIAGNKLWELYGAEDKVVQDSMVKHNSQRIQEKEMCCWEWYVHKLLLTSVSCQNGKECPGISTWHTRHTFCFFPYSPTFSSSKNPTCIHECFAKEKQTSQDRFFLMIEFKSFSISQNKICTIKKHYHWLNWKDKWNK